MLGKDDLIKFAADCKIMPAYDESDKDFRKRLIENLERLGDAGKAGAEAGKKLGIAFNKLKEQQNANTTKRTTTD